MASPCGSWISGLSITSTIIRATYPPGRSGHISSGEERPTGNAGACVPTGHAAYATAPRQRSPGTFSRTADAGDPSPGPGKEWHVTVESGAATTAVPAIDQPAPDIPDQAGEFVQLLTPEGERIDHPDYPLDLSADDIRSMYRDLVLVRAIDTVAISLQRQGELGIWAPEEHKFHLYTIVIGAQTLHATGYAMGIQRDGTDEAVIAYFGDGATSQGDVNEAFVFASVFNAPMVFFCQNNQWAISEPLEKQSRIPLYQRARGFGFPGLRVDGNDVLACYAVTQKALQAAREGQGPTLIEAFTYRMGAHTTTDDPTRYRLASELEMWKLRDPIERVRAYLVRGGLAEPEFFAEVDAEAKREGARVREACRNMPDPPPLALFDNVYAESTAILREEREQYAAYLDSFEGGDR